MNGLKCHSCICMCSVYAPCVCPKNCLVPSCLLIQWNVRNVWVPCACFVYKQKMQHAEHTSYIRVISIIWQNSRKNVSAGRFAGSQSIISNTYIFDWWWWCFGVCGTCVWVWVCVLSPFAPRQMSHLLVVNKQHVSASTRSLAACSLLCILWEWCSTVPTTVEHICRTCVYTQRRVQLA